MICSWYPYKLTMITFTHVKMDCKRLCSMVLPGTTVAPVILKLSVQLDGLLLSSSCSLKKPASSWVLLFPTWQLLKRLCIAILSTGSKFTAYLLSLPQIPELSVSW